jgi:SAM-dependent methyltransferase
MSDPTRRFSSRVDDYVRYRPSYPSDIVTLLELHCGLTPKSVVADIGSGTGLLSELFLKFGCLVFCVEPNIQMRIAGEHMLRGYGGFRSVEGRAENTTLREGSIDLVVAGQAFHWFDPARTREEMRRILKPEGWVALLWNERLVTADPFLTGYEALLHKYAPEYARVDHRRTDAGAIALFFRHQHWHRAVYQNEQRFDLPGVVGRLRSSSYAPLPESAEYQPMIRELEELFDASQRNGVVRFLYETKVYYGRVSD